VRACRKAGVPCTGLLSGGISGDELTAAGPAEIYPARLTCSRLCAAACWFGTMRASRTGAPVNDPVRRQGIDRTSWRVYPVIGAAQAGQFLADSRDWSS
jgi:hypothetical protein